MEQKKQRMRELTELLNRASKEYYANDREIMSNLEYDALYDELLALEKETGIVLADSPTVHVGYESVEELPKQRHEKPMLSLAKTKSREELSAWLGDQKGLLSWKLDGLTIVLTYSGGELIQAVTRGNGEIGEVITPNARVFKNIPGRIPFKGELILRGEAVIRYSDFERINEQLEAQALDSGKLSDVRYKNPRNLCSGSVRQLSSEVTAGRSVYFYAFALVSAAASIDRHSSEKLSERENAAAESAGAETAGKKDAGTETAGNETAGPDFKNSRKEQLAFLQQQGFDTVEYLEVTAQSVPEAVSYYEEKIRTYDIPSDGLVLLMDDIAYGENLGMTARFPRNSIAFKWADELQETTLREVEWSASRTGLINPVAIFDPVELEGTTVRRASVHNVSIVRSLKLGIGDRITVYKANMIIPQIGENLTRSGTLVIPDHCPVCGGKTEILSENDTETLYCGNPECPAKQLKKFALFTERNAMNIEGLSEMTLEKLLGAGFLHEWSDLYHLERYREEIISMEGFGGKSFEKLTDGIEASRKTTPERVLYALGIPGIGAANARVLAESFQGSLENLRKASEEELSGIDGIGPVLAAQIFRYFRDESKLTELDHLLGELQLEKRNPVGQTTAAASPIAGKTFVITGAVYSFKNRDELKNYILERGGKAAGSVSSRTDYLINNDVSSASGKNKKAKELGIPIISEEDFLKMAQGESEE